jgi:hypothetical protein
LLEGEFNLRHLPPGSGIFPWPIWIAFIFAVIFCVGFLERRNQRQLPEGVATGLLLGSIGLLSAFMAASLTWDSIPHGLRSIGGWPFAALIAGSLLHIGAQSRVTGHILLIGISVHIVLFSRNYIEQQPKEMAWWFDTDVADAARTMNTQEWKKFIKRRGYPEQAKMYFDKQYIAPHGNRR